MCEPQKESFFEAYMQLAHEALALIKSGYFAKCPPQDQANRWFVSYGRMERLPPVDSTQKAFVQLTNSLCRGVIARDDREEEGAVRMAAHKNAMLFDPTFSELTLWPVPCAITWPHPANKRKWAVVGDVVDVFVERPIFALEFAPIPESLLYLHFNGGPHALNRLKCLVVLHRNAQNAFDMRVYVSPTRFVTYYNVINQTEIDAYAEENLPCYRYAYERIVLDCFNQAMQEIVQEVDRQPQGEWTFSLVPPPSATTRFAIDQGNAARE